MSGAKDKSAKSKKFSGSKKSKTKGTQESSAPRHDLRAEATKKIVEALERGHIPWSRPWRSGAIPHNGATGREYHGGNRLMLRLIAMECEYPDPRWMTFNQARAAGYMVARGEHGTKVEYWKPPEKKDKTQPAEGSQEEEQVDEKGSEEKKFAKGWRVFTATVFNAHQILAPLKNDKGEIVTERDESGEERPVMRPLDEVEPYQYGVLPEGERIARAEELIASTGAVISFNGDRAAYFPAQDRIVVPPRETFKSMSGFYATTLHEINHWTGHATRLNREAITARAPFGSELYAKEELRAEIASVFLADEVGVALTEEHFQNHAAYIQSWIKVLKENKHELFAAARDAEGIADYVLGSGRESREQTLNLDRVPADDNEDEEELGMAMAR